MTKRSLAVHTMDLISTKHMAARRLVTNWDGRLFDTSIFLRSNIKAAASFGWEVKLTGSWAGRLLCA